MTIYSKNYKAIYTIVKTHIATFAEQQKRKKIWHGITAFFARFDCVCASAVCFDQIPFAAHQLCAIHVLFSFLVGLPSKALEYFVLKPKKRSWLLSYTLK